MSKCRTCLKALDWNSTTHIKQKLSLGKSFEDILLMFMTEMETTDLVTDFLCSDCTYSMQVFMKFIEGVISVEIQLKKANRMKKQGLLKANDVELISPTKSGNVKEPIGRNLLDVLSVKPSTILHPVTQEIKNQPEFTSATTLKTYSRKIGSPVPIIKVANAMPSKEHSINAIIQNVTEGTGRLTEKDKTVVNYLLVTSGPHNSNNKIKGTTTNASELVADNLKELENEDCSVQIKIEDDSEENESYSPAPIDLDFEEIPANSPISLDKNDADSPGVSNGPSTSRNLSLNTILDLVNSVDYRSTDIEQHNRVLSVAKPNEEIAQIINNLWEDNNVLKQMSTSLEESGRKRILLLGTAYFSCTECKVLFSSYQHLKEHCQVSHPDVVCPTGAKNKFYDIIAYSGLSKQRQKLCPVCGRNFLTCRMLDYHLQQVHRDYYRYKCQVCGTRFKKNAHYVSHLKNYLQYKHCKVRKCSVCKEKVVHAKYRAHMEIHRTFNCDKCRVKLISAEALRKHRLNHENPVVKRKIQTRELCTVCGKLVLKLNMRCHMQTHRTNRELLCDKCPKVFKVMSSLQKHIKTVHTNVQVYQCTMCKSKTKTKESMRDHIRLKHSNTYNFFCQICGQGFVREDYYRRHMLHCGTDRRRATYAKPNENNPFFCCKYCSKKYTTVHKLRMHLLASHLKNAARWRCRYCNLTFKTLPSRHKHEKRHQDPEGYELTCQICWNRFADKETLAVHYLKHEGSQKYTCDVCGEAFSRRYLLDHHKGEQHLDQELLEKRRLNLLREGLNDYKLYNT